VIVQRHAFMLSRIAAKRYGQMIRVPSFPGKIRRNLGFYLHSCDFRLTWRCNSQCIFCDIWKVYRDPEAYRKDHGVGLNVSTDEMSTEEIKRVLDDLKKMGTQNITYSGGEPTLRRDLCELIGYAHSKGMATLINTNGIAITEHDAEELVTSGLSVANFSIDGHNAELHDSFRGKGVFERAIRGLQALREASKKHKRYVWINVNAVLNKKNCRHIPDLIGKKTEWGVDSFSLVPVNISENEGSVYKNTEEFKLDVEDIYYIKDVLSGENLRRFQKAGLLYASPFGETREEIERNVQNCYTETDQYCVAPWFRTVIQPNGDVLPCCYSPSDYVVGNVRENNVSAIWDGPSYQEFRRKCKPIAHPICRWCTLFKHTNERWTPILKLINYGAR